MSIAFDDSNDHSYYVRRLIPLSELLIDPSYQRIPKRKHIKEIAEKFDPSLMDDLEVAEATNGKFKIIDGQNRYEALKILGIDKAQCRILLNIKSTSEEAIRFRGRNGRGVRVPLRPIEDFYAAITAGDILCVSINNVLTNYGFKVGAGANSPNTIAAIEALKEAFRNNGAAGFERVIRLLRSIWNGKSNSLSKKIISGMALLIRKAGRQHINDEEFVSKMRKFTPLDIIHNADYYHSENEWAVARSLLEFYNKGHSMGRIPETVLD